MSQSKLMRSFFEPFQPPFAGLASIFWIYIVFSFLFYPHSYVMRGEFPDTDDYTYLTQALDWLQGQSWFDSIQHRMAPPDGVAIHFSRVAQLPLAAFIMLFRAIGFPWGGAATLTAILYPAALLALFFVATRWVAECFMPKEWSRITAYAVLFSNTILFQFALGHVDHHGLEGMLVLLSFGCVVRMIRKPQEIRWSIAAASLQALALCIALEAVPWVIGLSGWVGLWMMVKGAKTSHAGVAFGVVLHLVSAIFLFATKRPETWFEIDTLTYSIVYVLLTGIVAVTCTAIALATFTRFAWLRYFVGVFLGGSFLVSFFAHFPDLIAGPYGAMDKELAAAFFAHISEAISFAKTLKIILIIPYIGWSLLGLGMSLRFLKTAKGDMRWLWAINASLVAAAIAGGMFYQVRILRYADMFSIIPLSVALMRGWQYIGAHYQGRPRFAAEIGLLVLVGPLLPVLVPSLSDGRSLNPGLLMFPMHNVSNACHMSALEPDLLGMDNFKGKTLRLMNMIDSGPELLFRTKHSVMAAPYHTNVQGNLDSIHFFSATDTEEARKIAQRDNIDGVLLCRLVSRMYFGDKGPKHTSLDASGNLKIGLGATLTERLMYQQPPAWLKEINLPGVDNYVYFEVVKSEISGAE